LHEGLGLNIGGFYSLGMIGAGTVLSLKAGLYYKW